MNVLISFLFILGLLINQVYDYKQQRYLQRIWLLLDWVYKIKKKLKKDDVLMLEKIQNFFILGNLKEKMSIFDFFHEFVFSIKFYKKYNISHPLLRDI